MSLYLVLISILKENRAFSLQSRGLFITHKNTHRSKAVRWVNLRVQSTRSMHYCGVKSPEMMGDDFSSVFRFMVRDGKKDKGQEKCHKETSHTQ